MNDLQFDKIDHDLQFENLKQYTIKLNFAVSTVILAQGVDSDDAWDSADDAIFELERQIKSVLDRYVNGAFDVDLKDSETQ